MKNNESDRTDIEISCPEEKPGTDLTAGIAALQRERTAIQPGEPEDDISIASLNRYRYFHYDRYREQLDLSPELLERARTLISQGRYSRLSVRTGFPTDRYFTNYMTGSAIAIGENGYGETKLDFGPDRILSASCYNWRCVYQQRNSRSVLGRDLCEHEAATLLMLENYLEKNNPGDFSNASGLELMEQKWGSRSGFFQAEEGWKQDPVRLVPTLEISEDFRLSVSFRAGTGKLFKVTKLQDLRSKVRGGEEMTFGKSTVLRMGPEFLDEEAGKWFSFIEVALEEDEMHSEVVTKKYSRLFYYSRDALVISSSIPLYGGLLDRFFELCEGKTAEYVWKKPDRSKEKGTFVPERGSLDLHLELHGVNNPETGEFDGIELYGEVPRIIRGQNYNYFFDNQRMIRLDDQKARELQPLTNLSEQGIVSVKIGRKHLGDFYHKTLPGLRKIAQIEEFDTEEIQTYVPPEPHFIVYLDVENDSAICRADVSYGTHTHTLLELIGANRSTIYSDQYRDEAAEFRVIDLLLTYLPHFDRSLWILFARREEESLFDLLDHGLSQLLEVAEVQMTDRFRRLGVRRRLPVQVGVSVESSLLDLDITSEELSREELLDILYHYEQKRRFVRLKSGDFLKLDENDTIAQLASLMETLHLTPAEFVQGKMHLPAYRALYLDKMLEQTQDIYMDRDRHFRRLIKEFKTIEDADYVIPHDLRQVLRKYQISGYRWLRTLDSYGFGGILADEMGLGKTLQVISVLLAQKLEREQEWEQNLNQDKNQDQNQKKTETSLVVCPASLVYNWGEELRRFAPDLKISLVTGTRPQRRAEIAAHENYDVLVTSYDLLKRDVDAYQGIRFRFEIIDEAQYIKNQKTAAAKAVKVITADTRYALTGTPIENRLSELWSIFDYLMPGFLYDYGQFRDEMETPIVKFQDEPASARLRAMISPFVLRRKKMDVLKDLPDKLEEIRYAGMEEKQRQIYNAQVVKMRTKVEQTSEDEFRQSSIQILAELTKIRQICCDPSLLLADYDGGSAKREACMELIRDAIEGEHKILVFSQFTSMLDLLQADLDAEKIPYYVITGATPKEKRLEYVNAFNRDETPVFLISLKAGGTGLNLTGADVVIHYDPWWNLAAQNQATDRAHRIGQKKIVTVIRLIMKHTIEEKILDMQESKKKLSEDILGGENIASSSINREDLMALLTL